MPSDEDIQEAILSILCEQFQRAPGTIILNGESVVEDVMEEVPSATGEAVIANFQRLYNDRKLDFTQTMGDVGTIELEPAGIDAYQELAGETVIPEPNLDAVLGALDEEGHGRAGEPTLHREDLQAQTELADDPLDMAVWYLQKRGLIDAQVRAGRPWYAGVAITEAGREFVEP